MRVPIRRVMLRKQKDLPEPARIPSFVRNLLAEPTWSVRSLLPAEPPVDTASNSSSPSSETPAPSGPSGQTPTSTSGVAQEITREKLHHLLRLSALPPPRSDREETRLLNALHRHLHFVRAVQGVNTSKPVTWDDPNPNPTDPITTKVYSAGGEVEPLITIRDETFEGIGEATLHLRDLAPALAREEKRGLNGGRRRRWKVNTDWDGDGGTEIQQRLRTIEALAEKKDWWIDVDSLGGDLESRKKGKYFFVRRGKNEESKSGHDRLPPKEEASSASPNSSQGRSEEMTE